MEHVPSIIKTMNMFNFDNAFWGNQYELDPLYIIIFLSIVYKLFTQTSMT
jgi:hypothetical protein